MINKVIDSAKKRQRIERVKIVDAGFTLIELLVVTAMVAILSAIAAPSWLAFSQQQRVSTVNDEIYRAIKEAQSEAKQLKLVRRVSFRENDAGEAEYALHSENVDAKDVGDGSWKRLGEEQGIKSNQILLWTTIELGKINNITSAALSADDYPKPTKAKPITIQFDQYGVVDPDTKPNLGKEPTAIGDPPEEGLIIAVSVPRSSDPKKGVESTSRCVIIKTILGMVQTKQGSDCRPGS